VPNVPSKEQSPFPPKTDFYTKFGAGLLADHITSVWVKRGHGNVVAERYLMGSGNWGIRSNLVDGLPPAKVRAGRPAGHSNGKKVLTPRLGAAA
jgi:hypothetical protein